MDVYTTSCLVFWLIAMFFIPAIVEKIHGEEIDFRDPVSWVAVFMIGSMSALAATIWPFILGVLVILFTVVKFHEKVIRPRKKK